jgi:hypothetical protein
MLLERFSEFGVFGDCVGCEVGEARDPGGEVVGQVGEGAQGVHLGRGHTLLTAKYQNI